MRERNESHNTSPSTGGDRLSQLNFPLVISKSHQTEMWAAREGVHTVSSRGVRVAKIHMHDWIILLFLGSIILALNVIHPFHRFVGKDMMSDLKYPHKHKNGSFLGCSIPLPIMVFLVLYLRQRDVYYLHHAILGILFSVMVTGVITDAIKDAVGRPRPDFFWHAFQMERKGVCWHGVLVSLNLSGKIKAS